MFQVHLFSYSLPFRRVMKNFSSKEGIILRLTDEDGVVGFGEISPLPGRSKETLDDVIGALRAMLSEEPDVVLPPSLAFGIETAYLTNMAAAKQSRLNEAIIPNASRRLPVNALLYGDFDHCLALLEEAKTQGVRYFKLKVGNGSIQSDSTLVRRLSDELPENSLLRLDANGAWNIDEAIAFGEGIAGCPIDYLEDPTPHYDEWADIARETNLSLAIDEFLPHETAFEAVAELPFVNTVVIKPTLYGGVTHCLDLASALVQAGKNVVFTSSYESDFGCLAIAHMASTISPTLAHGVWTPSLFTHGLLKSPLLIEDGFLSLESEWAIDTRGLEKFELDL